MADTLMHTYARLPVSFSRGEGAWLWDDAGNRYLDAIGGIAVCGLGHAHPAITRAVADQAARLVHTSNLYEVDKQSQLGDQLTAFAQMDRVFFGNSGAEANEAAIKIARKLGNQRNIATPTIVVMQNSFHGRTMATLTATGNRRVQAGFEPLVQGFARIPYNDIEALRAVAEHHTDVVAVLVEPIQGEGGINIPGENYLPDMRAICDDKGWLLMLDEIQTGMGRTGKPFAYMHTDIHPDVITVAKALGNGVPIGACLARGEAASLLEPGNHGSTFGGNPLACAAGLAVLETIEAEQLVARAGALGERLKANLTTALADLEGVSEVRGLGLMLGIELDRDCGELVSRALTAGVLINVTAGNVIRLLPAFVMSDDEADLLVEKLQQLISEFLAAA
jgi:acetylornithine aminotransferase